MANRRLVRNVLLKAFVLFVIFNLLYYGIQPLNVLDHVTVYNTLVPGRLRLPFGEYPDDSYNISLSRLDEMLASHVIARPKASDEYRVVMLGDSAVWGYLLQPTQTQTACLNALALTLPSGRKVRFYDLGYPTLTVTKDLLILRHALAYQPDLIVWSTSLASLYPSDQLGFPLIQAQYDELKALVDQYHFSFTTYDEWPRLREPTWADRTFFAQRRDLADWLRYQLYGLGWAATQIDHTVPKFLAPHPTSFVPDTNILSVNVMRLATPGKFTAADLSLDVVKAGIDMAKDKGIPILLVNEPIYRSSNDQRWNTYYPRWAYDSYRDAIRDTAASQGWHYLDLWDAVDPDQFTDTDFHLTPAASCVYAAKLRDPILALIGETN